MGREDDHGSGQCLVPSICDVFAYRVEQRHDRGFRQLSSKAVLLLRRRNRLRF